MDATETKISRSLHLRPWKLSGKYARLLFGALEARFPVALLLKASRTAAEMDRALKDPNFVIFELVTKENVPELLSKKILQLSDDQIYYLAVQQCPFLPDSTFTANFKLRARCLCFSMLCKSTCFKPSRIA